MAQSHRWPLAILRECCKKITQAVFKIGPSVGGAGVTAQGGFKVRRAGLIQALLVACLLGWPSGGIGDVALSAPNADRALTRDLRAASLVLQADRDGLTSAQDLFVAARADYARFLSVLYAQGYYAATITIRLDGREAADFAAVDSPARIGAIRIAIDPGPRFRFGAARMKPYAPGTHLPPAYRDGRPAFSTAITDAAKAGIEGWRQLGYAKATVVGQTITADHRTDRLDSMVLLDAGPKLRFGTLHVTGNDRMLLRPIIKIAGYHEGAPFDPDLLDKMGSRLRSAGVFRSVTVREADAISPGDRLDVTIAVEEEALHRFGFGAEASSLDGANLSAFWLNRNLFGAAERLRFDLLAKGIGAKANIADYKLGVRLERPGTPFTDSSAFVTAEVGRKEIPTGSITTLSFGVGVSRVITPTLTVDAGLSLLDQRLRAGGFRQNYRLLALPVTAKWDRRDAVLNPARGSYLTLGATPFWGFGTTNSGLQVKLDARIYKAVAADDRVILAGRLQVGTVASGSLLNTAPDYLFYSGGGGTVRGHPYQSLGASVAVGPGQTLATGGRSFIGLSGEVRASLNDRFGAAAFYDMGYVSSDPWFGGTHGFQAGAGLGVRYDTGFGPVRLDLAMPVGGKTGRGLQIYVGIGQAF